MTSNDTVKSSGSIDTTITAFIDIPDIPVSTQVKLVSE